MSVEATKLIVFAVMVAASLGLVAVIVVGIRERVREKARRRSR